MWRFLKKLEIELPYDPAIPLLGIHTEETRSERDTCTPMFIAALRLTLNYPNIYFIGSQCLPVLKPLYLHITDIQKVIDINFSALLRYN